MQPGMQFGTLLNEAFEAQLEGGFTDLDGALKWLDSRSGKQEKNCAFVIRELLIGRNPQATRNLCSVHADAPAERTVLEMTLCLPADFGNLPLLFTKP